jgi:(2Fe-2S) ferredoxin
MNNNDLARKAKSKGLGLAKNDSKAHHLLLCTGPNCFPDVGAQTLRTLNKGCRALREEGVSVFVSEVKCFRLCRLGPIAVVYPDGVWYRDVTPDHAARILSEHCKDGEVVEELAFLKNPLESRKT